MERIFLMLLLMFLGSVLTFSQARLGSKLEELKKEFADAKYNLKSGIDDDGDLYLEVDYERSRILHFFNKEELCFTSVIFPIGEGELNALVQLYNDRYVIMSSTRWKMYSGSGIANIELIITDEGT